MTTHEKRELINVLKLANETLHTKLPPLETKCATAYHIVQTTATDALRKLLQLSPEETELINVSVGHSGLKIEVGYEYETRKGEKVKSSQNFDLYNHFDRWMRDEKPAHERDPQWSINHSSGELKTNDDRNWHIVLIALGTLARELKKTGESYFTQITPPLREYVKAKDELSSPSYNISSNVEKIAKLEREIVRDEFVNALKEGAVYVKEQIDNHSWGTVEKNVWTIKVTKMTDKTVTWEMFNTRHDTDKEGNTQMRWEDQRSHDTPRKNKDEFVSMLLHGGYVKKS